MNNFHGLNCKEYKIMSKKGRQLSKLGRPISAKTIRRIENALANWDAPDSPARKRHDALMAGPNPELDSIHQAVARSERITESDLSIMVY